jgi:hypothetical protein
MALVIRQSDSLVSFLIGAVLLLSAGSAVAQDTNPDTPGTTDLSIIVQGGSNRVPVSAVMVIVRSPTGAKLKNQTDKTGTVRFRSVPLGNIEISVLPNDGLWDVVNKKSETLTRNDNKFTVTLDPL